MNNFMAAYIDELIKMSKKKKITAALILSISVIVVAAVLICTLSSFMGMNLTGRSEFSLTVLPVMVNAVIPLFIVFAAIDMFCSEYSAGTIKITLLNPVSRVKIYTAKLASLMTFAAAMLVFSMVASFIVGVLIRHTDFAVFKILASYAVSLFPLLVIAALASLIANITKGSGSSFMLCLIVYIAVKVFELLNPQLASFFFTSGMSIYVLLNAPLISFAKLMRMILIDLGFAVMLFAAGYALFENKEI